MLDIPVPSPVSENSCLEMRRFKMGYFVKPRFHFLEPKCWNKLIYYKGHEISWNSISVQTQYIWTLDDASDCTGVRERGLRQGIMIQSHPSHISPHHHPSLTEWLGSNLEPSSELFVQEVIHQTQGWLVVTWGYLNRSIPTNYWYQRSTFQVIIRLIHFCG